MKLKALIPSLREKKRYVAFEIQTEKKLEFDEAKKSVESSIKEFLGDLGMARSGIIFMKDWKDNKGIIKVNTNFVDEIKASLALIKDVNQNKAKVRSLLVSGSIDKVRSGCF